MSLTGHFVEFKDEHVILRTNLGDLRVNFDNLTCIEGPCYTFDQMMALHVMTLHDDDDHDVAELDDHGEEHAEDDHHDDHDDVLASIDFNMNIIAPPGISDLLIPVFAQGIAEETNSTATATNALGEPLPDDIGRKGSGGHGHGHEDELDTHSPDDHEPENVVDIKLVAGDGDVLQRIAVVTEEGPAIGHLANQEADVIVLDKPADDRDISQVARGGGGDITSDGQERVIAVEGLVVAVSPDNPIASVPAEAIPAIFSGEITNWSQIGGPDADLHLYSFSEDNAAFHYVEEVLLEPAGLEMGDTFIEVEKMGQMTANILADPLAIGVVPYANLRGTRAVPVRSSCGLVSAPTEFAIKTEEYTMQRRYYAYNRATVSDEAQGFLNLLDSPNGDDLVRKAGFIDLAISEQSAEDNVVRIRKSLGNTNDRYESSLLRDMVNEMEGTTRLSTNFRFAFGSSRLDVRARADVRRIVDYISTNRPSEVRFVGFTDSIGSFDANNALAKSRAGTILDAIRASLPSNIVNTTSLQALGYSELLPAACNDDGNGRRINRRVEVWVTP